MSNTRKFKRTARMRSTLKVAGVVLGLILTAVLLARYDRIELPDFFEPATSPYETYVRGLKQAGLHETALGRDWLEAAEAALRSPLQVTLPIEEAGYLAPDQPRALAYRINLTRGRRLVLESDLKPAPGVLLFIDIFVLPTEPGDSLRHLVAADSGAHRLEFEPRRTGEYIIRVQPELLRGGRYRLRVRAEPAVAFPVHGVPNTAIQSGFGAPRDGGARNHHGIDIFAPRGTPVLAVSEGVVTRVQETPRGGRVVWVRDERRETSYYYAHLSKQLVKTGTRVSPGDTLGLVGNTGNARSTPPHLHFGVYSRGPTDPRPWVARVSARAAPLRADTSVLGKWVRTRRATALRSAPAAEAPRTRELTAETVVRVLSARTSWYQVRLPDGTPGFVAAADATSAEQPLRAQVLAGPAAMFAQPGRQDMLMDTVAGRVRVLGRFGGSLLVQADSLQGWIADCLPATPSARRPAVTPGCAARATAP